MANINSLLKYRYQKKETEKLSQESQNSPTNMQSSGSTQEYELSKSRESNSTEFESPIFPGKRLAKSIVISDSEEDEKVDESVAVVGSSPWLSKESRMNGSSRIESKSLISPDDRELHSKVRNLRDMFPDVSHDMLVDALNLSGLDVEKATDYVIAQRTGMAEATTKKKRKYAFFQSSPDFSQRFKKPRCDEENGIETESNTNTNTTPKKQQKTLDPAVINGCISYLSDMFPSIPKEEIMRVLEEKEYDVEEAKVVLSSVVQPELVSQTQNVGSIKGFRTYRSLAKTNSHVKQKQDNRNRIIIDDDDEDDDEAVAEDVVCIEDEIGPLTDVTTSPNEPILNFFNNASLDELSTISGCTRKKAELIEKLRPFEDWENLVLKIEENCKILPFYLISECKELLRLRNNIQTLMEKCRSISIDLENFVTDLTGKTSMVEGDAARGYIIKQPHLLSQGMTLAPYQLVGVNWLIVMHSHNINGILGDEMGLGKTIETIAFFAHLLQGNDHGPHVVVCPSSTIDNWLRELKTWCPALKVLLYYGSQEERREIRNSIFDGVMEEYNVVVTTYNMASGSPEDRALFKKLYYHYAVFDEGHMLKNMASIRYQSLMKIQAKRRLLLTGTPLQNNLLELMSLLSFVMPEIFYNKTDNLKKIFSTSKGATSSNDDSRGSYEKQIVDNAKQILKPFFLRRLKSEVLQQLPGKSDNTVRVGMAFEQQDLYDELKTQFVRDVCVNKKSSIKGQSGAAMMMQLRKAANHHLLHRRRFDDSRLRLMSQLMLQEPTHKDANVNYIFEDMQVMSDFQLHQLCLNYESLEPYLLSDDDICDSGKFRHLDELLPNLKTKGDRILLFSQFTMVLDIIEIYMKSRGHRYLRLDGQTAVAERQEMIDEFNKNDDIFIFLLSTKAGGLGINLTSANVVILHDIDFNPYNDKQAEDRCHRLGQNRKVTVYRLVSKNTIEEAMLRCAQMKLKLEKDVTGIDKDAVDDESNDVASLLKEALQMKEKD